MYHTTVQKVLFEKFESIKLNNPAFSQRAYAKMLGISSGALSSILCGQRKISKKMARRFAVNLDMQTEELEFFLSSFSNINIPNQQNSDLKYMKIEMDISRTLSDWYHFAILSLIKLDDFQDSNEWIARRLGISVTKVENALERLINLKLIIKNKSGYERTGKRLSTTDDISNMSLKNAHKQNFKLAEAAMSEVDLTKRDITAMTMAIDSEKIPEAKRRIRQFQDDLSDFLESGAKKEIYKICMQLFPLSK